MTQFGVLFAVLGPQFRCYLVEWPDLLNSGIGLEIF
jgi:hypothetical protein